MAAPIPAMPRRKMQHSKPGAAVRRVRSPRVRSIPSAQATPEPACVIPYLVFAAPIPVANVPGATSVVAAEADRDKPKPQRAAARRIAYGGVCASLALLALAAIRLLPTADLALYALTSLCVAVAVVETGLGGGTVSWLAAAILGMLVTDVATGAPFLFLFGPYALIKALIESGIRGAVPRILVKL